MLPTLLVLNSRFFHLHFLEKAEVGVQVLKAVLVFLELVYLLDEGISVVGFAHVSVAQDGALDWLPVVLVWDTAPDPVFHRSLK